MKSIFPNGRVVSVDLTGEQVEALQRIVKDFRGTCPEMADMDTEGVLRCLIVRADPERRGGAMSKHTPGPWEVDITGGREKAVFKADDPGGQICKLPGALFEPSAEVRQANARLIAAAPDMLAALKSMTNIAARVVHLTGEEKRELRGALDAIAQAEPPE